MRPCAAVQWMNGGIMAEAKPVTFAQRDWLAPLNDPWTAQRAFFAYEQGSGRIHFMPTGASQAGVTGDEAVELLNPNDVFRLKGSPSDRKGLEAVNAAASGLLAKQDLAPTALISGVSNATRLPPKFVEGCLRILTARGDLLASDGARQVKLRLSTSAREQEQRRAFAASFAHELQVQADRVGMLIGHRPTVGGHREELLRALLQNHIPERFHAATGFISGLPNQFDILIYDRLEYAPHFRAGDLVVVPMSAVRAVIEVKSQLTKGALKDALQHLEPATDLLRDGPPIFKGVFAYAGAKPQTLAEAVRQFYEIDEKWDLEKGLPPVISDVGDPVSAICVLAKSFQRSRFIARTEENSLLTPVVEQVASLTGKSPEAALFFDLLVRFLRHPFEGPRPDHGFSGLLAQDMMAVSVHPILDGEWGPYTMDGTYEVALERRHRAYSVWLAGGAWDQSLGDEAVGSEAG